MIEQKAELSSINESWERLRQKRLELGYTVLTVVRLVEAGGYDLSENTTRRFFSERAEDKHTPTQHTIDVLNSVLFGTDRDDYDPGQAYRYFKECKESKLSIEEIQKEKSAIEAQCESLAARLETYEKAIEYYRRQLESQTAMNMKLLDMVANQAKRE